MRLGVVIKKYGINLDWKGKDVYICSRKRELEVWFCLRTK